MKALLGGFGLVSVALWVAAVIGWVINLVNVFGSEGTELMLRIIGIFVAPAGAIMGWVM